MTAIISITILNILENEFMNDNVEYRRKLQPHERRHFRAPNSVIPIVVRITGDVNKNQLKHAIEEVQKRHILLRVRVEVDESNIAWFTTDNVGEIPIKIIERTSEDQWISICSQENKIPFDYNYRPPIRIILLYSRDTSDLILFCHHMFSDGMSVAYLARDIMDALGNPKKELRKLPPPPLLDLENIPKEYSTNILISKIIKRINNKWKSEEIIFNQDDFLSIFNAYWENNNHQIQKIELSEKQTEELIQKCRREKVTVNSTLFSAFLKAQYQAKTMIKPKKQKAGIGVDVRNFLVNPAGESFGFYAAGVVDDFKYDDNIDFWDFTRKIHEKIVNKLSKKTFFQNLLRIYLLEPSIHDALMMKVYGTLVKPEDKNYKKLSDFSKRKDMIGSMVKKLGAMHFDFVLSNLGRLDFPIFYGDLKLERLLIFPPTGPTIETTIFVITAGGKLTIVMSYVDHLTNSSVMKKIKDYYLDCLISNN